MKKSDTLQDWQKKTKGKNKLMISFNQFVEYMRKEMEKKFQGRLAMKVEKVEKNNGVVIASLYHGV